MKISLVYQGENPCHLKTFLRQQGISRGLLAKIRHEGGAIDVDGTSGRKLDMIFPNAVVTLTMPPEKVRKEPVIPSYVPLKILYEDRDFLIVDKPAHLATIPSPDKKHRYDSLVNRVVGYYELRGIKDTVVHVITRLDRDTTGIVLIAKHRYAHALIDKQVHDHSIKKEYLALLSGKVDRRHFFVNMPIGREPGSMIKRTITEDGKPSSSEYFLEKKLRDASLYRVRLHSGRTHQIRVHSKVIGHPLVADTLYDGKNSLPLQRQGLHCFHLVFYHPFLEKQLEIYCNPPRDFEGYIKKNKKE